MKLILESDNPEKDIEAVAKSRIARVEGNKQTIWIIGIIVAVGLGVYLRVSNAAIGWALCILGLLAFIYNMNSLSKKQKSYKNQLISEWQHEQRQGMERK